MLRLAAGLTTVVQGFLVFVVGDHSPPISAFAGAFTFLGCLLILGLWTPVVVALLGIAVAGMATSWFPPVGRNLFDSPFMTLLFGAIAAAVVLLGPGELSIDARLFGRREIIIPHPARPSKN